VTSRLSVENELRGISARPKKWFGQNFLTDVSFCHRIADHITVEAGDRIVEIGPGLGLLTGALLERGYPVCAIEVDKDLSENLEKKLQKRYPKLLDIISANVFRVIDEGSIKDSDIIVSNLPFNISSSIMGKLLDSTDLRRGKSNFKKAVIMFQREFTERLVAPSGGKDYGRISVMFQVKMDWEVLFNVPRDRFYPVPKVDATVISFGPRRQPNKVPLDDRVFSSLVALMFRNRRKKIKNSLRNGSIGPEIPDNTVIEVLERRGIGDMRPEELEPGEFVDISNDLISGIG